MSGFYAVLQIPRYTTNSRRKQLEFTCRLFTRLAEDEEGKDGARNGTDDEGRVAGAEEGSEEAGERTDSRADGGEHDAFAHERLLGVLVEDEDLILGMNQTQGLADFDILGGGVRGEALNAFALAFDLLGEGGVAGLEFLDLTLFVEKCSDAAGAAQGDYGIAEDQQNGNRVS